LARNVWSSDPGRRRSGRGKLIGAAVVVLAALGAAAAYTWWPAERVDCETLVGQSQTALDKADSDLRAASKVGTAARCNAYRARVTVLTELAKLPAVCGPPPKRPGSWPSPTDERKWYETLIFEECR
jgi:Tfp pilus assembly protein PilX